jgi:DNA-binding LytR/AlgR family response regulator
LDDAAFVLGDGGMIELDLGEGSKVEVSRRQTRAFREAFRL